MRNNLLIKKNLLDIEIQKNLQKSSIAAVVFFTYFTGVIIALLTDQLSLKGNNVVLLIIISLLFVAMPLFLFFDSLAKIREAATTIKNLE